MTLLLDADAPPESTRFEAALDTEPVAGYEPRPLAPIPPRAFSLPLEEWTLEVLPEHEADRISLSLTNPEDPEQVYYRYSVRQGDKWWFRYGRTAQTPYWADQVHRHVPPDTKPPKDKVLQEAFNKHFRRHRSIPHTEQETP